MCVSPRSFRRAMNREVTPPGRSGERLSGEDDQRYASASSDVPTAAHCTAARSRRRSSTDKVAPSRAIFRTWPVLVDRISTRPGRSETDRRTRSTPFSKSTSDHRRPQSSPRRQPVVAATKSKVASSGSFSSARSMRSLISSGVGASGSFRSMLGGDACAAWERSSETPLDPLVEGGRAHSVVPTDAGGREAPPAQPVVEGVEVRRFQLPQVLRPQFLGDGGSHTAVFDQGLGRSSAGLDVVEPAIEKASEGLVGQRDPSLRRLIDQSRRLFLGVASSTMDSGVRVPVATSVGVPTKGHPDLPNAWRSLT